MAGMTISLATVPAASVTGTQRNDRGRRWRVGRCSGWRWLPPPRQKHINSGVFATEGTYVNIQLLTVVYYQKDSESRRG